MLQGLGCLLSFSVAPAIMQELKVFKKFADALLNRSSKVTDLLNTLLGYEGEMENGSADSQRLQKSSPQQKL